MKSASPFSVSSVSGLADGRGLNGGLHGGNVEYHEIWLKNIDRIVQNDG